MFFTPNDSFTYGLTGRTSHVSARILLEYPRHDTRRLGVTRPSHRFQRFQVSKQLASSWRIHNGPFSTDPGLPTEPDTAEAMIRPVLSCAHPVLRGRMANTHSLEPLWLLTQKCLRPLVNIHSHTKCAVFLTSRMRFNLPVHAHPNQCRSRGHSKMVQDIHIGTSLHLPNFLRMNSLSPPDQSS